MSQQTKGIPDELNKLFEEYFIPPEIKEGIIPGPSGVSFRYWRETDPDRPGMVHRIRLTITSIAPQELDDMFLFAYQAGGNVRLLSSGELKRGSVLSEHWAIIKGIPGNEEVSLEVRRID